MNIQWNPEHPDQALIFIRPEEVKEKAPQILSKTTLFSLDHPIRFCKILYDQGVLSGTFAIPQKAHPIHDKMSFAFVLDGNSLYFISGQTLFQNYLNSFMNEYDLTLTSAFEFLLRFMNYMIQEDVYFLEDYNEKLETIEENIFEGKEWGMERFIMMARRDMNILGNYYLQLTAVGETMQETIIPQNAPNENAMVSLFLARSSQLQNLVDTIKDNTDQIWNLRQTQLSDKQNKISTVLTITSTVFLPLTFLTGWYGMNFQGMPLIENKHGYWIIVAVVVIIVICEIIFIKRRHWLYAGSKGESRHDRKEDDRLALKLDHAIKEDHKEVRHQRRELKEESKLAQTDDESTSFPDWQ